MTTRVCWDIGDDSYEEADPFEYWYFPPRDRSSAGCSDVYEEEGW